MNDREFMLEALCLARRGEGTTRPNPPVGAVVVKNGMIIGRGFHRRAGEPHAEILALAAAGEAARGSSLYVTLEPCSTRGRTPPCTDAIIAAGVRKVVYAATDPNPVNRGRAARILRQAGIAVASGVCEEEASELLAPFRKWVEKKVPFLTLKLGMTIDGRIADGAGASRWITSPQSREMVRALRRRVDAVMVGAGTVRADDPSLVSAGDARGRLWRVIVDGRGEADPRWRVFADDFAGQTILATVRSRAERRLAECSRKGARVWILPSAGGGRVRLKALLRRLGRFGILHVLCEGGGRLAYEIARQGLADRYVFFIAPRLLGGGRSIPAFNGPGWRLNRMPRLRFLSVERTGEDILVTAETESGMAQRRGGSRSEGC